eukprot:5924427-Ditylum_brightwellii.AAC.1
MEKGEKQDDGNSDKDVFLDEGMPTGGNTTQVNNITNQDTSSRIDMTLPWQREVASGINISADPAIDRLGANDNGNDHMSDITDCCSDDNDNDFSVDSQQSANHVIEATAQIHSCESNHRHYHDRHSGPQPLQSTEMMTPESWLARQVYNSNSVYAEGSGRISIRDEYHYQQRFHRPHHQMQQQQNIQVQQPSNHNDSHSSFDINRIFVYGMSPQDHQTVERQGWEDMPPQNLTQTSRKLENNMTPSSATNGPHHDISPSDVDESSLSSPSYTDCGCTDCEEGPFDTSIPPLYPGGSTEDGSEGGNHLTHTASHDSKYKKYACRIDREQGDKSVEIALFAMSRPHMRAFHFAWISFFVAFFAWFAITPLLSEVQNSLNLTKVEIWNSSICSVAGTVLIRFFIGPVCDNYGARWSMAACLFLSAIPTMMTGLVNTSFGLNVLRLFVGIAGGSFVVCQYWTSSMFTREVA